VIKEFTDLPAAYSVRGVYDTGRDEALPAGSAWIGVLGVASGTLLLAIGAGLVAARSAARRTPSAALGTE
jgi:hypothetical protein